MGQEGIASAVFDHMNKSSHNDCNICRKGTEKLEEAREIARLSREDQTMIHTEDWHWKKKEKFLFLFWSDYMFLLKHMGKWFLQTHYASLCRTNWWEDLAWGGRGTLKYSCHLCPEQNVLQQGRAVPQSSATCGEGWRSRWWVHFILAEVYSHYNSNWALSLTLQ